MLRIKASDAHTTAKLVISRRGKDENGCEINENENARVKHVKLLLFCCQTCKFVTFLSSSSLFLKFPNIFCIPSFTISCFAPELVNVFFTIIIRLHLVFRFMVHACDLPNMRKSSRLQKVSFKNCLINPTIYMKILHITYMKVGIAERCSDRRYRGIANSVRYRCYVIVTTAYQDPSCFV